MEQTPRDDLMFTKIEDDRQFPTWAPRDLVADFFHETMKPYNDTLRDVQSALSYALEEGHGAGGFLMLAHQGEKLQGALLMLRTGMHGYVPENILLFVTIDPSARGQGIGGRLIKKSIAECEGKVKLHVEYDNPAKRLYERLGFTSKYAEMRYERDRG